MASSSTCVEQQTKVHSKIEKYRKLFDYSESKPRNPITPEWPLKKVESNRREHIKYPFRIVWNNQGDMANFSDDHSTIEPCPKRTKTSDY